MGADAVINTTKENYMEEAMAITGGKGYEYVFETAGQVPTMHMAFELAANKAHVCFIGTPHADLTFTPKQWENMNRKNLNLQAPGCPIVPRSQAKSGILQLIILQPVS